MPRFSRRRLLEKLCLAASAPLLFPIASSLIQQAQGQTLRRRVLITVVIGECAPAVIWVPEGVADYQAGQEVNTEDMKGFAMPPMFKSFAAFQDKFVIVDGLHNPPTDSHGTPFGMLSCHTSGNGPEGPTIDQHIAKVIGRSTPVESLLFGFEGVNLGNAAQSSMTFAAGKGAKLPHDRMPSSMYKKLLGLKGQVDVDPNKPVLEKRLLDVMRGDVQRLNSELAGEERARLGFFLDAIEEFEARQAQLHASQASGACDVPADEPAEGGPFKRMESFFNMSTLALKCGLTNVVGVSFGLGTAHDELDCFQPDLFTGSYAHTTEPHRRIMTDLWNRVTGHVAQMLTDTGLKDDAVVLMVTGQGVRSDHHNHHGHAGRTPAFIYDGPGTLKTGGRFLRLNGKRALADAYCAVAHAAGVPTDRFAADGPAAVLGPPDELMA